MNLLEFIRSYKSIQHFHKTVCLQKPLNIGRNQRYYSSLKENNKKSNMN